MKLLCAVWLLVAAIDFNMHTIRTSREREANRSPTHNNMPAGGVWSRVYGVPQHDKTN